MMIRLRSLIRTLTFALTLLTLAVIGCDTNASLDTDDLLVIEAFLYEGEPVTDVTLTKVLSLSEEAGDPDVVNNAEVTLIRNEMIYPLVSSGGGGKYEYPGDDLDVNVGDTFELRVQYGGSTVTAETTVPEPPTGTTMSVDQVVIPSFSFGPGGGPGGGGGLRAFFQNQDNGITVVWDNQEGDAFFVAIRTPESENPDFILPEFIRDRFAGIEIVTQPTTANFHDVRLFDLEVVGKYTATVYRINQEYVDLYLNREQDSRDLNEPPTNIVGGLGVFSAFSRQEVQFELIRE